MTACPTTSSYFSANYFASRERFVDECLRVQAEHQSLEVDAASPSIEPLTIDIGKFGVSQPRAAVVVTSGVHGVEAPLGSAIQLAVLEQLGSGLPLPADVAVVLVHAVNPYGFAWNRRFNEHNVDLNRNFLLPGQRYQGAPPLARAFRKSLGPASRPLRFAASTLRMGMLAARFGQRAFWDTLPVGQYDHPDWLFYGGDRLTQSGRILQQVLPEILGATQTAIHLDIHTGLGKWSQCELLMSEGESTEEIDWWRTHFSSQDVVEPDNNTRYEVRGGFGPWLQSLLPQCEYHYATAEFGTYSAARVIRTLAEENRWTRMEPTLSPQHWSRLRLAEAFAPRSLHWRAITHRTGMQLVARAIELVT